MKLRDWDRIEKDEDPICDELPMDRTLFIYTNCYLDHRVLHCPCQVRRLFQNTPAKKRAAVIVSFIFGDSRLCYNC